MGKSDFSKRLLVGITGFRDLDWKNKLREIEKYKLTKVSLFLERFKKPQRKRIYEALLRSKIKSIPLVHIRDDMVKSELSFLSENFGSKYFTIHEFCFKILHKWRGFYKNLYLENNTDNKIASYVNVERIGGFCVDLSHFKKEEERWTKEFEYVIKRRSVKRYFACNHINGYSYRKNQDLHTINTLKDFEYLKTLPKFLFGKVIGIETENSIKEQLKFKKYLTKMLNKLF